MRRRRDADGDVGQALVEFALIIPVLLILIVGLFDVARAVEQENTLAYAARYGARYAIVHGSTSSSPIGPCSSCSDATITSEVTRNAVSVTNITVTIDYPDANNDRGSHITVDATAPFVPLASQFLLNGALSVTLRGGSEMVIQH